MNCRPTNLVIIILAKTSFFCYFCKILDPKYYVFEHKI